ncbi:DNA polymerase III subunit delta [Pilimelia columellifera]|uniref:DNA-directed DNA polymerase n=1 Tax=Pilimelia columellifera subsp. columellifera TaxID=706583 RepID=A0ABN3NNQ8_9ACTN
MTPSPPAPLLLILGDEELLVGRAIAAAKAANPEGDLQEHEAASLAGGQLAEALSPSLFGGRRMVIITSGQDARKDLVTALLAYAVQPDPDISVVVAHAGGAKGKALADGLRAAGATVVPAAKIKSPRDRVDFVRNEIRRLGGQVSPEAADALLEAIGHDLREVASACAQLISDAGSRVTVDTIARYYCGRAEVTGFTVADATMVGDVPGALESLRWALLVGVDPVPIADALADGVRTVARVASAGRASPYQLASSLGMPAWKVERAQRQARGWSAEGLAAAMSAAAVCNAAVKGAAEDRGYALERTVFAVAAARDTTSAVVGAPGRGH